MCHPQTLEVLRTRAEPMGWCVATPSDHAAFLTALAHPHFGALVPMPSSTSAVCTTHAKQLHEPRSTKPC